MARLLFSVDVKVGKRFHPSRGDEQALGRPCIFPSMKDQRHSLHTPHLGTVECPGRDPEKSTSRSKVGVSISQAEWGFSQHLGEITGHSHPSGGSHSHSEHISHPEFRETLGCLRLPSEGLEAACIGLWDPTTRTASQLHVQWIHVSSWKLATAVVFTPQKLADATNQGVCFPAPKSRQLTICEYTNHCLWCSKTRECRENKKNLASVLYFTLVDYNSQEAMRHQKPTHTSCFVLFLFPVGRELGMEL